MRWNEEGTYTLSHLPAQPAGYEFKSWTFAHQGELVEFALEQGWPIEHDDGWFLHDCDLDEPGHMLHAVMLRNGPMGSGMMRGGIVARGQSLSYTFTWHLLLLLYGSYFHGGHGDGYLVATVVIPPIRAI